MTENKMKKILYIAYYFPPKGLSGVQRTAKFIKYLARKNYLIYVLTVNELSEKENDYFLLDEVNHPNIKIIRTDYKEPQGLDRIKNLWMRNVKESSKFNSNSLTKEQNVSCFYKFNKKIYNFVNSILYIPDKQKCWIKNAIKAGSKIIEENKIDVLISTSEPNSAHLISCKLKRKFNIKWIADFRDGWLSRTGIRYNSITMFIHSYMEECVITRSDKVISVSKPIVSDFINRYNYISQSKFEIITNGYDEEDFSNLILNKSQNNNHFTLLYNGSLYEDRSPEKLFIAIDNMIEKGLINIDKIKVLFVGKVLSKSVLHIMDMYIGKYPQIYSHIDYVTHEKSLNYLCSANALLLIIDEVEGSNCIVTGKIFEYIRTGKPILGIVPEGAARDIILDTNTGKVASPNNINEIEFIILSEYNNFFYKDNDFLPDWTKISHYSRERLTEKLIKLIEE